MSNMENNLYPDVEKPHSRTPSGRHVPLDMTALMGQDISISAKDGLEICFNDLRFDVTLKPLKGDKGPPKVKTILKNVSGTFKPGRLTAVMGASGAGKTSLLQLLAGETLSGDMYGSFYVNGSELTGVQMKTISGFVFQDDIMMASMTVREAITMSALLRLPSALSVEEKHKRVDNMIRLLNLEKAQNTIIGNHVMKGVSGGERKRTAMAMELITNPTILFLDEPTSGLDTFTAFSVVKTLKGLASTGRTVVSTIHQPSSEIFRMFDDLILMADGNIVFAGPIEDSIPYFETLGYVCPKLSNPADFIFMRILNSDPHIAAADEKGTPAERIQGVTDAWAKSSQAQANRALVEKNIHRSDKFDVVKGAIKSPSTFKDQYLFLFERASKNAFRNPFIVRVKLIQTLFFSLISCLLYQRSDLLGGNASFTNITGFLFFLIINNTFSSCFGVLSVFADERRVFNREYGAGYYNLTPYFTSKVLVETPFYSLFPFLMVCITYWTCGLYNEPGVFFVCAVTCVLTALTGFALGIFFACIFPDLEVALAAAPLSLMPLILFSGLFANSASLPVYFSWIQYISPMKYGYEALYRNQFRTGTPNVYCVVGPGGNLSYPPDTCIFNQFGNDGLDILSCCLILLGMMLTLMIIAYFALLNTTLSHAKPISAKKARPAATA